MTDAPLRIGVIGLGRAFSLMVPTFARDPRVKIVAGFDPRDEPRRRLVSDFGATTYDQAESLCADLPAVLVAYLTIFQGLPVVSPFWCSWRRHPLRRQGMGTSMAPSKSQP